MNINELLYFRGLPQKAKIKLVRHQDKRYNLQNIQKLGYLEIYQSYQSEPVFECEYIVTFMGLENNKSKLIGVYKVEGRTEAKSIPLPEGFPEKYEIKDSDVYYTLTRVSGFEDIENRVVIDWGRGTLAWHQWLSEKNEAKEVIEILPKGYVSEFKGYVDCILSYSDLTLIINNPNANCEWHRMLSAVAGIYLIVDGNTGKQYVGSAYGENGILGRWRQYAKDGHGGNSQLKRLVESGCGYEQNFQYSILHTLPKTLTAIEVIKYELIFKEKLGSRAFGLNSN